MKSWMPGVVGVFAVLGWTGVAAAQEVGEPSQAPAVAIEPGRGPGVVVEPAVTPVVVVEPVAQASTRLSLIYSPELALQNTSFGSALNRAGRGEGITNIGFEVSAQTGWYARYHAQLDFTHGYGANGARLEPLAFGWAAPLVRIPGFTLELEPLLSLADGILLVTNDSNNGQNLTVLVGSGAEVQLNLVAGPFYAFLSPLGVEVRWLQVTTGAGGSVYGGADPLWRFRAGIGAQF